MPEKLIAKIVMYISVIYHYECNSHKNQVQEIN